MATHYLLYHNHKQLFARSLSTRQNNKDREEIKTCKIEIRYVHKYIYIYIYMGLAKLSCYSQDLLLALSHHLLVQHHYFNWSLNSYLTCYFRLLSSSCLLEEKYLSRRIYELDVNKFGCCCLQVYFS